MRVPDLGRRGVSLLEVLVALVLLGSAALAAVGLVRQSADQTARARGLESRIERADQTLAELAILGRAELERRLGDHQMGEFIATVQRPEAGLFRIAVRDTGVSAPLLVSLVARADSEP